MPATAASPATEKPRGAVRSTGQPSSATVECAAWPADPLLVCAGTSPGRLSAGTRPSTAATTASAVSTRPVAPVQDTATSARVSSWATWSIGTARALTPVPPCSPRISASRSARSSVRLATTTSSTPARASVAAASEDMEPAPITSARLPLAQVSTDVRTASCSRPKVTSDCPARSMPVSECARLPTRRACWKRSLRRRPAVCSSWARARASLICPRICPSPTTIESSPHATEKRWWTARSS